MMTKRKQQLYFFKKSNIFTCSSLVLAMLFSSCSTANKQAANDSFQEEISQPAFSQPAQSVVLLSLPQERRQEKRDQEGVSIVFGKNVVHVGAVSPQSQSSQKKNQIIPAYHTVKQSHKHKKTGSPSVSTADFVTESKLPFVTPIAYTKKTIRIRQTNAKQIEKSIVYASPDPEQHPDEYLWDGGDRDHPVHFDKTYRLGLETEDTIAEYSDHTGKRHQKPTNRVAIYAPRFNVVRSMSVPVAGASVDKVAGAQAGKRIAGINTKLVVANHNQKLSPTNMRIRSRAGGLESKSIQSGLHQAAGLIQHEKLINIFQGIAFLNTGQFDKSDKPILARTMQAAAAWSKDLYPVIQGQVDGVGQLEATFQHSEFVGIDTKHLKKGRLRIVKLADKKSAKPGDVITFKIRYDNLGDLDLHHIRIIDNLTPRLEYIEDSATSDLAGRLNVEENGEGSLVLKFILEDSLKGHKGGVITFQTKVR